MKLGGFAALRERMELGGRLASWRSVFGRSRSPQAVEGGWNAVFTDGRQARGDPDRLAAE